MAGRSSVVLPAFLVSFLWVAFAACGHAQGPLEPPPGPPAPSMKTLNQIEPRTPIHNKDLPLTITQPGSYYLAENIKFTRQNVNAITISTPDVTIDLMGFSLTGPGSVPGNTGTAIIVDPLRDGLWRTNVLNGSISGWSGSGINLNSGSPPPGKNTGQCFQSIISHVNVTYNGGYGIRVYEDAVITECTTMGNTSGGIYAVYFSLVKDSISTHNGGDAMAGSQGCRFINNICSNNIAGSGINAGWRCFVEHNQLENNHIGVLAAGSSVVIGNNATGNVTNYQVASDAVMGPIITAANQSYANAPNANYSF